MSWPVGEDSGPECFLGATWGPLGAAWGFLGKAPGGLLGTLGGSKAEAANSSEIVNLPEFLHGLRGAHKSEGPPP